MKNIRALIYLSILFSFATVLHSEELDNKKKQIDSLEIVVKNPDSDIDYVNTANELAGLYKFKDINKAFEYAEDALIIAKKIGYKQGVAHSYNNIGSLNDKKGNFAKAIENLFLAVDIYRELNNVIGLADSYNVIGIVHWRMDEYKKAQDYFSKSIKAYEKIKDSSRISTILGNLGLVCGSMKQHDKALEYLGRALDMSEKALNDSLKPLTDAEKEDYLDNIGTHLCNIGNVYSEMGNYSEALKYFEKSLKLTTKMGDEISTGINVFNIGDLHFKQGDYDEALGHFNNSLQIFITYEYADGIIEAYKLLYKTYEGLENTNEAYENYKHYIAIKDSLFSKETKEKIAVLELKEKQRVEQIAADKVAEEEDSRNYQQYSLILFGIVFLFIVAFMSGKVRIRASVVLGIVFLAYLLLFEFILVLLDPYIDFYSDGEPLIKLSFNGILALMIFPIHAKLEKKVSQKVVSK